MKALPWCMDSKGGREARIMGVVAPPKTLVIGAELVEDGWGVRKAILPTRRHWTIPARALHAAHVQGSGPVREDCIDSRYVLGLRTSHAKVFPPSDQGTLWGKEAARWRWSWYATRGKASSVGALVLQRT
ncbi:hypothetical protein WJX74_010799 [Apatococcus lobatus]|uniref:Uncharacterized protein n=1 Tax=Apatococcus lobatus TaxID=904363 RepID=A0AAW1QMG5_9CHLO